MRITEVQMTKKKINKGENAHVREKKMDKGKR